MLHNLVLLIGSNPLPNLITALKLKDQVNKVFLIYSIKNKKQIGTKDYADSLEKILQEKGFMEIQKTGLSDISARQAIEADLQGNDFSENAKVHLNYTGGTKTMAVHVYRYLESEYGEKFTASYLDARNHQLINDNIERIGSPNDLRNEITIDILTMIGLHNYEEQDRGKNYEEIPFSEWSTQTGKIEKWVVDGTVNNNLLKPVNENLRTLYKDREGEFLYTKKKLIDHFNRLKEWFCVTSDEVKVNKFQLLEEELKKKEEFHKLLDSFGDKSVLENGKIWNPEKSKHSTKKRLKHTLNYLDGKWLESIVAIQIEDWAKAKGLPNGTWGFSFEAKKPDGKRNFELDAFVIHGYQLIGISVTTDSGRSHVKNKGFEVIHRVKQIGGDEALAILVTGYQDKSKIETLQDDLSQFTGTPSGALKVIGQNDWLNMGAILDHIIQKQF